MTTLWQPFSFWAHGRPNTVVGTVLVLEGVDSSQLGNRRNLYVYLPPSYEQSTRRYPVIYMHDGQNLFDQESSYAGEWHVDETLEQLSYEGREAIVVGIANAGVARIDEYGPFAHGRHGGKGERYLNFIIETVKPLIDDEFRTRPDSGHTGTIGSSMGGLISLYAHLRYPEVFGFAGVLSPSLWFGGEANVRFAKKAPFANGTIYMDVGTQEVGGPDGAQRSARYARNARRMYELLVSKGHRSEETIRFVEDEGGHHNERDWARRLPDALRFLLPRL
ncbi:MAG: alpha/beta hydrolase-fold protein [Chloroflexaceae bacterium]|nr:alpha/beta hydrolase-fold protein [Chloroflexaceae bacterium]